MGLETAITILENIFFSTSFTGQVWLMKALIIVGTLVFITRDTKSWMSLALPVMIGWEYFGMNVPIAYMLIAGIIMVVDALSLDTMGSSLGGLADGIGKLATRKGRAEMRYERMDIRKEMQRKEDELTKAKMNRDPTIRKAIALNEIKKKEKEEDRKMYKELEFELRKKAIKDKYFSGTKTKYEE